ncbi:MAG: tail fiber domain-containing protein, partial [Fusobacteriaceae bacterium]
IDARGFGGVGQVPAISFAIGDNDTGFNWASDGVIDYWANNVRRYSMMDVYHNGRKPSAADVGALPTAGGTMGGVIYTNHTSPMISNVTGMHFHSNSGLIGFLNSGGGWAHYVDNSGNFVAVGNVTAYSDIKLKKDITIIDNAMDKINSLNGYTYTRKDSGERHTGVIAQEVQKVLPEAIQVSKAMEGAEDQTDTLSVAYGNMVGLLIEGIKELKREIDDLKKELNDVKGGK